MPTTLSSLFVLLFAVLPGVPAEYIFTHFAGSDWRKTDWEKIVNILIFSILGFVFYLALSPILGLPLPNYIYPTTFTAEGLSTINLTELSIAYLGHWFFSAIVGFLLGIGAQYVAKRSPSTVYSSSWDVFNRSHVPGHWVVVTITVGNSYAGILSCADLSVGAEERDIILEEPAKYDGANKQYISLPYRSLFLPSSLVSSIAVIHDPDIDERITDVGSEIFSGENDDK